MKKSENVFLAKRNREDVYEKENRKYEYRIKYMNAKFQASHFTNNKKKLLSVKINLMSNSETLKKYFSKYKLTKWKWDNVY